MKGRADLKLMTMRRSVRLVLLATVFAGVPGAHAQGVGSSDCWAEALARTDSLLIGGEWQPAQRLLSRLTRDIAEAPPTATADHVLAVSVTMAPSGDLVGT
jgi:hypothetical protein